jgi:hypothetical protein
MSVPEYGAIVDDAQRWLKHALDGQDDRFRAVLENDDA